MIRRISGLAALTATLSFTALTNAMEFTEVQSSVSGLNYVGETWGASWGDFNGDRYPDIFSSNHRARPSVWRNNGDGTFTDIILQFDTSYTYLDFPIADTHGGAWGDFDNNGVKDLLVLTGVNFPPALFVNDGYGIATDETDLRSFPDDFEGRTATWFDYDNDGELDVVINNRAPNILLKQTAGSFSDVSSTLGLNSFRTNFGILSDMDADNTLELMAVADGDFPEKVYKTDTAPFLDITAQFPTSGLVVDAAMADFNNDLVPDILLVRGNLRPNQALKVVDGDVGEIDTIEAWLAGGEVSGERSMSLQANGPITVTISTQLGLPKFYVGASGYHPAEKTFVLDPDLVDDQGFASYDVNTDQGFYIGYDTVAGEWQFHMSPGGGSTRAYIAIDGIDMSDPVVTNLSTGDLDINPKLFINDGVNFTDTSGIGLSVPISCIATAVGDFDNDMDQDIYMVCRNGIENTANKLYENLGDGTFNEVTAFGAEGVIGAGLASGAGVGENVVTADYDVDGWLDLYVTNGLLMNPIRVGGPDQLFRNTSGDNSTNRYLLLDLVGTVSNRDAIGAKVIVTAGGVTQLREMGGNYHRWSQNHMRLHVGLGQNDVADIEVIWPNGEIDSFASVAANDLYEITQGASGSQSGSVAAVAPTAVPSFPGPIPGDECGVRPEDQPVDFPYHFDAEKDKALFIWKDCSGTDKWYVRGTAGNDSGVQYEGQLITNAEFTDVTGFSLEAGNDVLDTTDPEVIDFFLRMSGAGVDGFDFTLESSSAACLDMSQIPTGGEVYLGKAHIAITTPINLSTLSTCIDISVEDTLVGEGDGNASVNVSLSAPSTSDITVDYTLVSGTALADSDFVAGSGTVTFLAGETSKAFDVTLIQDALLEQDESFTIELSNASGAFIFDGQAVITITDDEGCIECDEPTIDRDTEQAIFVWKNFSTGVWSVYATAGGDADGVDFSGAISSTQNFTSVVGDSIESNDTLDYTTNPSTIEYNLRIWNSAYDAFEFVPYAGSTTCFTPTGPAGYPVLLGADKTPVNGAFNLDTIQSCTAGISVSDLSVSEGASSASFIVELSEATVDTVTVDYVTASGTALGGVDFVEISAPQTLTFNPGEISKTVDVSLIQDTQAEGDETFTLQLSNAVNAALNTVSAQATIVDDEASIACGAPSYDPATEQAMFVWKDCITGDWFLRATAAGTSSFVSYVGDIVSSTNFELVIGRSIESDDIVDNTTDPAILEFSLGMRLHYEDGVDFKPVTEAGTCLTLNTPVGGPILLGANKTPVSSPFDLSTLGDCVEAGVGVSVSDVQANESDASATFEVALSGVSTDIVTVDYITSSGTAVGDVDYVEVSTAQTLIFNPGEISKTVDVALIQDAEVEGDETFTLLLSNPVNAALNTVSAEATIVDDEVGSACGAPTYDPATEQAMFVWKDCITGDWFLRATAAGTSSFVSYVGDIVSSTNFELVIGRSIESDDIVDNTTDPAILEFSLGMRLHYEDGVDFKPVTEAGTCLTLNTPVGGPILLGANKTPVNSPFDLGTLAACP